MIAPSFAVPVDPAKAWMMGSHGPMCIPAHRQHYDAKTHTHVWIDQSVNQPGLYGRYFPIDLDANNRHSIDAYCERFPDRPRPVFGWGVCRQGFGLQDHKGILTEDQADAWAIELNSAIKIGEYA